MSTHAGVPALLVAPFPAPGPALTQTFTDLAVAANGSPEQRAKLGDLETLPRPWDPASLTRPLLRRELWTWLEAVVAWLNTQYAWETTETIPPCWPAHPHLVHEIAVLADQRRLAGLALSSDALEDWHRYALPSFTDRMRTRTRGGCQEGHQPWPARSRQLRYVEHTPRRHEAYDHDVTATLAGLRGPTPTAPTLPTEPAEAPEPVPPPTPRLTLVDTSPFDQATGEILDRPDGPQ